MFYECLVNLYSNYANIASLWTICILGSIIAHITVDDKGFELIMDEHISYDLIHKTLMVFYIFFFIFDEGRLDKGELALVNWALCTLINFQRPLKHNVLNFWKKICFFLFELVNLHYVLVYLTEFIKFDWFVILDCFMQIHLLRVQMVKSLTLIQAMFILEASRVSQHLKLNF